jgi:glyoxylase I family protein
MIAVRLLVREIDKALVFYCERLGFTLVQRSGPAFAMVEREGVRVWLSGPGSSAARALSDGRVPSPGGWNRVAVQVSDLEAEMTRLKGLQVTFASEPVRGPGGVQVLAEDGVGNVVEIFQPA